MQANLGSEEWEDMERPALSPMDNKEIPQSLATPGEVSHILLG